MVINLQVSLEDSRWCLSFLLPDPPRVFVLAEVRLVYYNPGVSHPVSVPRLWESFEY
jgi:hypothetical protein